MHAPLTRILRTVPSAPMECASVVSAWAALAEAAEPAVTQVLAVAVATAVLLELAVTPAQAPAVAAARVARAEAAAPLVAAGPAVVMVPAARVDRSKTRLPAIAKRRELRQVKPRTLPYPSSELRSS